MTMEEKLRALRAEHDSIADMETLIAAYKLGRDGMLEAAELMARMVECTNGCDGAERIADAFRELKSS